MTKITLHEDNSKTKFRERLLKSDVLVYVDDEYIIHKKRGVTTGTMFTGLDLLDIAIAILGFNTGGDFDLFANDSDVNGIIDSKIEELRSLKK